MHSVVFGGISPDSWPGASATAARTSSSLWTRATRRQDNLAEATDPGKYFTGDGARRDADGDYRITGRVDDVINLSGHRMGTAEVESALVAHARVSEAAVVDTLVKERPG